MEADLNNIICKPSDFKICKKCNSVNWYENENCHNCDNTEFKEDEQSVIEWCQKEYKYWKEIEIYDEEEADNIFYDV